jgi:predicted AlkP superfamily phosphohydrolase/phosphomutase
MGIDALDAELASESSHPNLTLKSYSRISTIESANGELSTHELWPTIITGLPPEEHGITLDSGVGWESPVLRFGSSVADTILPDRLQSRLGAWLLNNTENDVFRTPTSYYEKNGVSTLFDAYDAKTIGIPNYVTNLDVEDREHELRRNLGELFERDMSQPGGHSSADPDAFYEQAMEMVMIRLARTRRAYRSHQFELVFGYTSGVDLIGHIAYNDPQLQDRAYDETNEFVGDFLSDLGDDDTLVIVSDHGLQDGIHTDQAMIASTEPRIVEAVDSVVDLRAALEAELADGDHEPVPVESRREASLDDESGVQQHLEDLGYM